MENNEIVIIKADIDNMKESMKEMKAEIKNHDAFSTQIALLAQTVDTLTKTVEKLNSTVENLKGEDGKNFNALKMCAATAIITTAISLLINFLFSKF